MFEEFTRQYSLSKTLRFELRPVRNTKQMLIDNKIVELDKKRKYAYEKTKPFFNKLHQEFISESLRNAKLKSLSGYLNIYRNWKVDNKNKDLKNELEKKEKKIREEIIRLFDATALKWAEEFAGGKKIKKGNIDFLFEAGVFSVLKKKYDGDSEAFIDEESIFDGWDKWSGYFKKFFETRKNFYKSDGKDTRVATRVVNDNLRRFCDNIKIFETVVTKINFTKLENELNVNTKEMFDVKYYPAFLNQEGIDQYNTVVGGKTLEGGEKIQGLNEYINEHRQKTNEKLPRFKNLDKQIGSDRESAVDIIENEAQLREILLSFVEDAKEKIELLDKAFAYVSEGADNNFAGIYFRKEAINTITRRWFASTEVISLALIEALRKSGDKRTKFNAKTGEYKFPDFISWQAIRNAVEELGTNGERLWRDHYYESTASLIDQPTWQQFLSIFQMEYDSLKKPDNQKNEKDINEITKNLEVMLKAETLKKSDNATESIKAFSDRVLRIYQFAKYFSLEKSRQWNPDGLETSDFYVLYDKFYVDTYEKIVKVYNKIRNYLTKKPFNQDKWVLNFENPTLADGWDKNKETDNTAVILRKDGRYYLGVMDKKNNRVFKNIPESDMVEGYEKVIYKLLPDPAKMMPKVCFSKKGKETFNASKEILRIYENAEFKKGDTFSIGSMQKLIAFYKKALSEYEGWKLYDFKHIKDTKDYIDNIGQFYSDVAKDGYKIAFKSISDNYINQLNQEGKLYLFEIHNQDWNLKDGKKKKGAKNLHTLYFEQVFSEENEKNNFIIKLNGEAELFFRPATDKEKLGKREIKGGKNKGEFVTKNKRYAGDKMFFHVPITLNRTSPNVKKLNQSINVLLAKNPDINIIGIDRGEKHLAYFSVINQKSEILEIKSLNEINGINYAKLLEERAKNRESARREWKSIEKIKDLKKGYISNVVREIADLIIRYNAIVVFEDLNMGFKRARGGIEKSIYQQLEKALIEKLNFLVDKKQIDSEKAGHVLNAYQLTAPFTTFKKMYKQTGVLFYTQAEYTSQTDPVTGFRKNVYISNSTKVDKIRTAIQNFDAIGWDDKRQSYYFDYNPINFIDKKFEDSTISKQWRVYANVPRIKRERKDGYWETIPVNPNKKLKKLFELWGFDNFEGDIQDQIFQMNEEGRLDGTKEFEGKKRNFWQSFVYLFNLVLQLRNSTATQYKSDGEEHVIETIEGVDFISSPVAPFFCTDGGNYTNGFVNMAGMEKKFIGDDKRREKFVNEFNGDANGAYNIARKGLILLKDRISNNFEKPDLFISRKDWDKFAQKARS